MPARRQEYAILEWDFLRFDQRYRDLPDDEARAYLHWWAACIHVRRERFSRAEVRGQYLADLLGVDGDCLLRLVASGVGSGLLSRGPGGAVTVEGVRSKHPTLRWWNDGRKKPDCGDDRDRDPDPKGPKPTPPHPPNPYGSDEEAAL